MSGIPTRKTSWPAGKPRHHRATKRARRSSVWSSSRGQAQPRRFLDLLVGNPVFDPGDRGTHYVHDSERTVGSCPRCRGWNESTLRGQPAQRAHGRARMLWAALDPSEFGSVATGLRRTPIRPGLRFPAVESFSSDPSAHFVALPAGFHPSNDQLYRSGNPTGYPMRHSTHWPGRPGQPLD